MNRPTSEIELELLEMEEIDREVWLLETSPHAPTEKEVLDYLLDIYNCRTLDGSERCANKYNLPDSNGRVHLVRCPNAAQLHIFFNGMSIPDNRCLSCFLLPDLIKQLLTSE
jgi:hypothetical protein